MSVYQLTLQILSPVHIGDGRELRQDFDFVVWEGHTYRLDEDRVLSAKMGRLRPGRDGRYPPPGKLLEEKDFANPEFFLYSLRGSPRSAKTDARIKSFIKDVYDRPYIPGSSLKGALRTALAWTGWNEINPRLDRSAFHRKKSFAGQPLEKQLFGPDPNHDLLRALQVSDLHGPQQPGAGLHLVNAQVLTRRSMGSPIELEALAGDRTFTGSLKIDDTLFTPAVEKALGFSNRRPWLDELMARVQKHSQARILELADWFEKADSTAAIARFYRRLKDASLEPNQALVQIGWGTGWDGKTFWTHLLHQTELFEDLVRDFKMERKTRNSPPRRAGDPFPRSKRAVVQVKNGAAQPAAPFGWVLVELKQA